MSKTFASLGDFISPAKTVRCGDGEYPVLSMTMHNGIVMQSERFKKSLASKDQSDYKVVKRGQLVVGFPIDEGVLYIQEAADEGIMSPAYNVWNVRQGAIEPAYLELCLHSPQSMHYYKNKLRGTTARRRSITTPDLLALPIPLPPLDEQRRIAAALDKIDSLTAKRRRQLEKLDELVKSRFVEMFGDVIINNRNWPIKIFPEIASSRLGKMLDAKQQTGKYSFPYLGNFNVQWFRFDLEKLNQMDFDEADQKEFSLEDGDLMVCEGGEIGRCAVWHSEVTPCYFQKAIHRVRCNLKEIIPEYLAHWFKYNCEHGGFSSIEGAKATIAHLPGAKLKMLKVVVPPLTEQKIFVDFLSKVEKTRQSVTSGLKALETLKKSLMQNWFA